MVGRQTHNLKIVGSNPAPAIWRISMETPYDVKEVLVEKVCPGFIYRLEIISGAPSGSTHANRQKKTLSRGWRSPGVKASVFGNSRTNLL